MKKILKYLIWIPFALSLGSLLIYIINIVIIKMNPNAIVTEKTTITLKTYLLIALVSLFIGLFIVLIKKIYNLLTINNMYKTKRKKIKKSKKIKNEEISNKNDVLKVQIANPEVKEDKIVGKLTDTMQDVEIYVNNKKDYNFKLDGISCPECSGLISKDAAICPHCGILFDDAVMRVLSNNTSLGVKKKKSGKKIIIVNILLIILFIFLIFLISNLIFNKGKENNNNINPVVLNEEKA